MKIKEIEELKKLLNEINKNLIRVKWGKSVSIKDYTFYRHIE